MGYIDIEIHNQMIKTIKLKPDIIWWWYAP